MPLPVFPVSLDKANARYPVVYRMEPRVTARASDLTLLAVLAAARGCARSGVSGLRREASWPRLRKAEASPSRLALTSGSPIFPLFHLPKVLSYNLFWWNLYGVRRGGLDSSAGVRGTSEWQRQAAGGNGDSAGHLIRAETVEDRLLTLPCL